MSNKNTFTVGVNLTWLVPGVVGGSEEYTIRLLQSVGQHLGHHIKLRLYGRPELFAAYPDLTNQHEVVRCPSNRTKLGRVLVENSWLARASGADDAVHHAGGTVPFVRRAPAIVTIHDLQPLEFPEYFQPAKRYWLARAIPATVAAARLVLCPSEFTASRIAAMLDVDRAKLRVVPHGHRVSEDARPAPIGLTDTPEDRFGAYLLYPAIAYPHKRHIDVVRALDGLGGQFEHVSVVFTGRAGPELDAVMDEAERLGLSSRVHALGRIPAAELESLYRSARALVFPSAYEGFGNPALEAMSLQCPVICSDAGALAEVVGEAGLMVPVGDVAALRDAIGKILADPSMAEELRRRGAARAARFDTGIAASRLAEVYGELAAIRPEP